MRPNRLKQLWREGKSATCVWLASGDPYTAEVLANAGFDAIVIDMQHGFTIGPERLGACLQAVSSTAAVPIVRVAWNDPVHIQYALDAGAYGVIVPLVNSPAEAAQAVGACYYPPIGSRSFGPNRVEYYAGADYFQHANEEVICLVMIEHINAVEQIEAIAQVPGISGFFIGPGDLALSMDLSPTSGAGDPRHVAACQDVLKAARSHGLVAGTYPSGPVEARDLSRQGFNFFPIGADVDFLTAGAQAALETFRQ